MAKVNVLGDSIVITSALKLEDIKKVQRYQPDALVLKGGEDGKDEIFRVAATSTGSISDAGIGFASVARDGSGLATLTIGISGETDTVEKLKESIVDMYGTAIANLNKIEQAVPAVVTDVVAQLNAVAEAITIA